MSFRAWPINRGKHLIMGKQQSLGIFNLVYVGVYST